MCFCGCVHEFRCPQRPEEDIGSFGATRGCEPSDMGAGKLKSDPLGEQKVLYRAISLAHCFIFINIDYVY